MLIFKKHDIIEQNNCHTTFYKVLDVSPEHRPDLKPARKYFRYNDNGGFIGNRLRPMQNGRHFPDDIFKCIFVNENIWILIDI